MAINDLVGTDAACTSFIRSSLILVTEFISMHSMPMLDAGWNNPLYNILMPDYRRVKMAGGSFFSSRLFTQGYLQQVGPAERRNESRLNRRETVVWQRRFWEHMLRDEEDLNRHLDYIHYNPVKHGLVN